MAYTYNSSNIGSSGISTIRFLIGDTSSGQNSGFGLNNLLTDGEVEGATTLYANNYLAASKCCEVLAARHASQPDVTNEGLTISASQRYTHWMAMAKTLKRQANLGAIYVGGRKVSEKTDAAADDTRTQPAFSRDMDDYDISYRSTST